MKRFVALATIAALALAGTTANAVSESTSTPKSSAAPKPLPVRCTIDGFRPFSAAVWRPAAWNREPRGRPPEKVIEAFLRRLGCAPGHHRAAMQRTWRRDKAAFYAERRRELWRERVTPFFCVGQWWATECTIPLHESGYGAGGGNLYGMLDAWALHGCTAFAPSAWDATKREQDICAHRHWVDYGRGGWPAY